jgi:N-acetylglucosaminyldiphosphoundecaprenol N-acetyl-beta-D-mannosaminyltransferase
VVANESRDGGEIVPVLEQATVGAGTSFAGFDRRFSVLGVQVSITNMQRAIDAADDLIRLGERGYICVTGVHGVMESQSDEELLEIHNSSFLTVPDGMPLVWLGKLTGFADMGRVYGPDFMIALCMRAAVRKYNVFLYGGAAGVVEDLKIALEQKCPGLNVVGTCTPPFRPLNEKEEADLMNLVAECQPDIFWVGLSTPKQERFMAKYSSILDTKLMVGVGAAFDMHTGRINDSPAWLKNCGLQWLHRLCQEPRRLWRRYLFNNPRFLYGIGKQLIGLSHREGN